jgi:hypothetical protein
MYRSRVRATPKRPPLGPGGRLGSLELGVAAARCLTEAKQEPEPADLRAPVGEGSAAAEAGLEAEARDLRLEVGTALALDRPDEIIRDGEGDGGGGSEMVDPERPEGFGVTVWNPGRARRILDQHHRQIARRDGYGGSSAEGLGQLVLRPHDRSDRRPAIAADRLVRRGVELIGQEAIQAGVGRRQLVEEGVASQVGETIGPPPVLVTALDQLDGRVHVLGHRHSAAP